jgi:nitrate reductase assembly molybdenum cofactor insertion protein NarJ
MGMNRRSFFRKAATGAAVLAIATSPAMAGFDWFMEENPDYNPFSAEVLEYVDYTNFSSFAITSSIDQMVEQAAAELAKAYGIRIAALVNV